MAACNRRGRKAEAHRRWESVSSTIDIPCGVVLNDVPDAAVNSVAPSFQNKPSSSTSSEAPAARAAPPPDRQQDGHPGGGGDGSSGVNSGGVGVAGPAHEQTSGGGTMWEDDGDDDDKEVYIPTEDLGVFMATLMDGMRSDGVQLAQSAKNVVANTYQVRFDVARPVHERDTGKKLDIEPHAGRRSGATATTRGAWIAARGSSVVSGVPCCSLDFSPSFHGCTRRFSLSGSWLEALISCRHECIEYANTLTIGGYVDEGESDSSSFIQHQKYGPTGRNDFHAFAQLMHLVLVARTLERLKSIKCLDEHRYALAETSSCRSHVNTQQHRRSAIFPVTPAILRTYPCYTPTLQVVVRPWEAVTRMAAPFLPTNPPHIQPSRENTKRGQELLDNALAFRMPGAFGSARPRQPGVADDRVGAGNGGGGALRTIDGNSPPRSTPPSSPSRGRSSRAAVAGGGGDARAAGVRKRGRGAQRGRLGAVKLEATPPKDGGSGSSRSGCELPSAVVETAAVTTAPLRSCSPPASPSQGCGVGGGLLRRLSLSKSPPRRTLYFKNVLPFGGGGGGGETGSTHRCRAVAKPAAAAGVGGERAGTGAGPRRPPAVVTEGSRIDLRGLDRAKGGNNPRAYRCKDGSIVVLGRERMLSVLPYGSSGAESGSGVSGGGDGGAGSSGVVTWVLRYTELESCSINVSAGKESEHAVGDVVVEVTTRRVFISSSLVAFALCSLLARQEGVQAGKHADGRERFFLRVFVCCVV